MLIATIDTGSYNSAILIAELPTASNYISASINVVHKSISSNVDLLAILNKYKPQKIVAEHFKSFGMPVGDSVISSCYAVGLVIYHAIANTNSIYLLPRKTIANNICHSVKASDANIRKALLDVYPDAAKQGFKKDLWSALAIYQCYINLCNAGLINNYCAYGVLNWHKPEGTPTLPYVREMKGEGMRTTVPQNEFDLNSFFSE